MSSIKLSNIDYEYLKDCNVLIDYMIDNKYTTLLNDYGFGIEYELCEIEENYSHIKQVLKKVGIFVV